MSVKLTAVTTPGNNSEGWPLDQAGSSPDLSRSTGLPYGHHPGDSAYSASPPHYGYGSIGDRSLQQPSFGTPQTPVGGGQVALQQPSFGTPQTPVGGGQVAPYGQPGLVPQHHAQPVGSYPPALPMAGSPYIGSPYIGSPYITDQSSKSIQAIIAWVLTLLTLGYFLPWAIAATRGKSNAGAIGLLTFLLGWSFIGWVIALVMACGAHRVGMAGVATTREVRPGNPW